MKILLLLVTACSICLSALTSVAIAADAASSTGAVYCWKSKLYSSGDNLVCNWATTATEACKGNPASELGKSTIATEPTDARRCENGQQLVTVNKK